MQQSLTVLASFLALLLVAAPAWGIKQRPGGERPSEWRKEALRGRMAREFDPTITSLGYCDPKTYPRDGKRLPAITFDTPITDLKWAHVPPYLDKVVYALLESRTGFGGGHLWRSTQYGDPETWEDISAKMKGCFDDKMPAEQSGIMAMHFFFDRTEKILFQGAGGKNWIQEEAGKDFEVLDSPGGTMGLYTEIKIHPTQRDWLLAKALRSHCQAHGPDKWCAYDVFMSKDFGRSWQNLTANSNGNIASFIDFAWGSELRYNGEHLPGVQDETVFATVYEKPEFLPPTGPFGHVWDTNVHFVVSHDWFTSKHNKVVACGNMFEIISKKIFLAMPSACPTDIDGQPRTVPKSVQADQVSLYVSDDLARSFQEICMPTPLEDRGYNLVRTHDAKSAFLIVDHDEQDSWEASLPIGNVYAAGANASTLYSMSLRRNFRRGPVVDFVRVEGMPGTFLANQLDEKVVKAGGALGKNIKFERYIQSKVTFNNGARWRDVEVPTKFRHPECNACTGGGECKLHLHGPTSWFWTTDVRPSPSLYTHENAPGIVLATGNVGEFLDTSGDRTCTWMSQDGGLTWADIANHAAMYEFGDHGNIVLVSSFMTQAPTDKVFFSIDDGRCFNTIELEEAIYVENIRVEPKGASHIFYVHGVSCYTDEHERCKTPVGNERQGKIVPVDVREMRSDEKEFKTCEADDYTDWAPPGGSCMLGRNFTMQRQIWDHYCFNPLEYQRPHITWKSCDCAAEDFACEFGYEDDGNGGCKRIHGLDLSTCPSLKNYKSGKKHMRLVHGDVCTGPGRFLNDGTDGKGSRWDGSDEGGYVPSPSGGGGSSGIRKHWWALLVGAVAGLAVFATVLGVWWRSYASEYTKASVEDALSPVVGAFDGLVGGIRGRFSGAAAARAAQEEYFQPLEGGVGLELGAEDVRSPSLLHNSK